MDATRLKSLDGLRGIAAVVVVLHHAMLVIPAIPGAIFGEPVTVGLTALIVNTPLHLVWGGTEAVYLFFVLSGLVLAFATRSSSFAWSSYFPSRIVRLYLPVVGAVLVGALLIALTPPRQPDSSAWVQVHPGTYDVKGMLADITLVGGTSGSISPLWSLQWEVLFSVLLPVYIYAARRVNPLVQLGVFVLLSTLGAFTGVGALLFLPMFGIGVALAALWDRISELLSRVPRTTSAVAWTLAVVLAVLMVTSHWSARLIMPIDVAVWVTVPVILCGIIVIILAAAHAPALRAALSMAPIRFLGLISFSLYLVHEPVLLLIAGTTRSPTVSLFITLPLSIALAAGFWYLVERPAHRLSRRVKASAESSLTLAS